MVLDSMPCMILDLFDKVRLEARKVAEVFKEASSKRRERRTRLSELQMGPRRGKMLSNHEGEKPAFNRN